MAQVIKQKKGVNVHINKPVNYQPEKIPNLLKDINFVVEHNENSPFWRLFYDYCSGWWDENEIISIIRGKGDYWIKNTNNPRIRIINVFYGYAFEFLRARYKYIKNNDKDNQKEIENIESIFKKYDTGAGSRN